MAEVKWIKITVDMFDDEKIKIIQSMPEGDALLVVWIKLITLAGKTNDGGYVYISDNMPYTDEMLSVIMNKPLNTIRLALDTFIKLGMIENDVKGIYLLNFEKHQSLDKLEKIKEQNRLRARKFREKQKLLENNVTETLCNDIDIDKDKELDIEKNSIYSPAKAEPSIPYKEITEYLNNRLGTNYRHTTTKTKDLIKARFNESIKSGKPYTLEDFKKVIDKKCAEWMNTDMQKYLRPETLFGTKFESYLNQQGNKQSKRKEILPEWLNKTSEENLATEEEQKELQERIAALKERIK